MNSDTTPTIVPCNADGSAKEQPKPTAAAPELEVFLPFPDGSFMKYQPRMDPATGKQLGTQCALFSALGTNIAIVKNASVAECLCDAVNQMFASKPTAAT